MGQRIHLFPIEPIEERYSADWYRWWPDELQRAGFEVHRYAGDRLTSPVRGDAIRRGQFLDAVDTHYYKATQLARFCEAVQDGEVRDGDVVLFLDGWNPAVTAVAYMRDVARIQVKIVLVLHAGTWDPQDHLTQCGMWKWARHNESGWMLAADRILVATEFHRDLIMMYMPVYVADRVHVTGFPLELDEIQKYRTPYNERPMQVAFPHRLAPEKQPEVFDELRVRYERAFPGDKVEWVRTQDLMRPGEPTKPILYETLGRSRVAFSAALQETWGIVQLEAWYLHASPLVPDRLAYRELYPPDARYSSLDEAVRIVHDQLHDNAYRLFSPARDPRRAWGAICRALEFE